MIAFKPLFSNSVFGHARVLAMGALLAPGRRTVASVLRVMGLSRLSSFQNYHRVLNRAQWSARRAAGILLTLLVRRFSDSESKAGPLVFGLDDTIERRRGRKIKAKGIYRDPVRSSQSHFVKASGLRWLSLMYLPRIPWAGRVWALPFLTLLCPSERFHHEQGRCHKKLTDWARQSVVQLRRWLPGRALVVTCDSSFSAIEFLAAASRYVTVVTRLRLDAALYAPAPPRRLGTMGRPRKKGQRLPTLKHRLTDSQTRWQRVLVSQWYGQQAYELDIATGTGLWYHPGMPVVALRWVLVRDPRGRLDPKAFLCTDEQAGALAILSWFVRRWTVEVTFEEVRRHLGVETQRQWSELAIVRTTPCLLGLFSLVTLVADALHARGELTAAQSAWYKKKHPTFSDALASVRMVLWKYPSFSTSEARTETLKIPRPLFERLTSTLAYAA
ncbi:MAG: transposase [Bacteroidota bacterium]